MSGLAVIEEARQKTGGFLTEAQVALVAADEATRLFPLLVRCGNGRFVTPAQNVKHFIGIIDFARMCERETGEDVDTDYVRDVSIPANVERYQAVLGEQL